MSIEEKPYKLLLHFLIMKQCELCGEYTNTIDAIMDGRAMDLCRMCALSNNAIILEKPSVEKLKKVERLFTVKERLEEAAGLREKEERKKVEEVSKKTTFPETVSYILRKEREKAGLSKEKLAEALGIKEEEIERIEKGEEPSEIVLRKYEQFFKKKFKLYKGKEQEMDIDLEDEKTPLIELFRKAKALFTKSKKDKQDKGEVVEI